MSFLVLLPLSFFLSNGYTSLVNNSPEIWLSVDLSSPFGTIALHKALPSEVLLIGECVVSDNFQSSEKFLPRLRDLLTQNQLTLANLSRLITTSGPGSFTGLRIAYSSLKALAMSHRIPFETISGSEARAMSWMKETNSEAFPQVVTQVASKRFCVSVFPYVEEQLVEELESAVAIADDTLLDERTNLPETYSATRYPLRAKHLGACLLQARTRKTSATLAEQIALSPDYFGNTRF